MKTQTIIRLQNVHFSYNAIPVLEDISLSIRQTDFLGIIGPNGGGKTTLLKLILGLLEPTQGDIRVFGQSPRKMRHLIGYMPQLFVFDFSFPISVMEVALMGRLSRNKLGRRFSKSDHQIAYEALKKVGMESLRDRDIGELSGGQRQRVFIARALAMQPRVLLLDEPVASVDPQWQKQFFELLHQLNNELAIVLVTHDVSVLASQIDQLACVNRKLFYHGSTREGIHKISELYHCPMEIAVHEVPHRLLGDHHHD